MSDPSSYTVGWICAITTEIVAAKTMLDEIHEDPAYTARHDNNSYALGRVGKHNVAIAVLPDGEYGTTSAAAVARDMVHSFPNVRIGLMVGIGGGAPSAKHDIRLGDVVVSSPRDGKGGVFEYNFGKTIQDQKFETTGFLDQPPALLRAAVASLRAEHEEKGPQFDEAISSILSKKPRLRQKYQAQGVENDCLYQSSVVHPPDVVSCTDYCSHQESNIVLRQARGEDDDNPVVHYGLIASANQLMKDATVRDRLAEEEGVLCFEMEAAGLMNHFPCLVIRGICDYSDSHKNKAWQGYAAMAAAAYTKQLLAKIAPSRVESEMKIVDTIASMERKIENVGSLVVEAVKSIRESDLRQQKWLHPSDPSTNHNNALAQRHRGTGVWLLRHKNFTMKTSRSSCLWLYGITGCGKTVLSSTVIECLEAKSECVALLRFYFDFSDEGKQTLKDLLRSLVSQLGFLRVTCQKLLDGLFSSCSHGARQPSCGELRKLFSAMLKTVGEVWIVIDALDECSSRQSHGAQSVLAWLRDVLNTEGAYVRIITTSRPERDIESAMDQLGDSVRRIPIQGDNVEADIRSYALFQLQTDPDLAKWRDTEKIQAEIEQTVLHNADGMFRLVACRLNMLRECISEDELSNELANLPRDLSEVYARILLSIPQRRQQIAIRILQLLLTSSRPLKISELLDAVAVDIEGKVSFNVKRRPIMPMDIAAYCSSLTVMVRNQEDPDSDPCLQLAHFSVKEYLTSGIMSAGFNNHFHDETAKQVIAEVCVTYLLQIQGHLTAEFIRQQFPFAQFCSENWYVYAATPRSKLERLHKRIMRLLTSGKTCLINCHRLHEMDRPWGSVVESDSGSLAAPLYYASFAGFSDEVAAILFQGEATNAQGGRYGNALQAASYQGHDKIVEMLLAKGANVNAEGGYYGNALQAASYQGHTDIAVLLLAKGGDPNAFGGEHGCALRAAFAGSHAQIIKRLLDEGADFLDPGWAQSPFFPLHRATQNGWKDIVEELLKRGVPVNVQDYDNMSPLHYSVLSNTSLMGLLLDIGHAPIDLPVRRASGRYDVDSTADKLVSPAPEKAKARGLTPLHFAVLTGSVKSVRLLIQRGADVACRSENGETLLHVAIKQDIYSKCRHIASDDAWTLPEYRLEYALDLIDFGPDSEAEYSQTASRIRELRSVILDMLLEHEEIDADARDDHGSTPLHCVRYKSPNESFGEPHNTLEKLLSITTNVSPRDNEGRTPLQLACQAGDVRSVEMLLVHGACPKMKDYHGLDALKYAAQSGNAATLRLILNAGLDCGHHSGTKTKDNLGATALHHLMKKKSHFDIEALQALLHHGANVDDVDSQGWTPLAYFLQRGSWNANHFATVIEIVFQAGADPKFLEPREGLLYCHIHAQNQINGDPQMIRVLQNQGVDLLDCDGRGRTIAHHYAISGHYSSELIDLLTDIGLSIQAMDMIGWTPLDYATEAKTKTRSIDCWRRHRWMDSWRLLGDFLSGSRNSG